MYKNEAILVLLLLLTSCASFDLTISSSDNFQMKDIPIYCRLDIGEIHQSTDYTCATVSATMGIKYVLKSNLEYDEIKQWKISGANYSDAKILGNDMPSLIRLCEYYGIHSQYFNKMTIEYLEYQISKGNPVVINIRPNFPRYNTHALLVVGYDKEKREVYCCDPSNTFHLIKEEKLEEIWSAELANPRGMSIKSGLIIYNIKNVNGKYDI